MLFGLLVMRLESGFEGRIGRGLDRIFQHRQNDGFRAADVGKLMDEEFQRSVHGVGAFRFGFGRCHCCFASLVSAYGASRPSADRNDSGGAGVYVHLARGIG